MNSSVSNQNSQAPSPPEEVHLSDYLNVLIRRRKTFLVTFLAVFIAVLLVTFLTKPVYEATATLHVKDEQAKGGVLGELSLLASNNPVDSEIEIVQSRTNAENVVKRLHLDWQVTKQSDGLGFQLLEFTSTAGKPSYVVELTGVNTYRVRDDDGSVVGSGTSGVPMRGKGISLLVGELRGKAGDSFRLGLLPFNETVDYLRKTKLKVKELGKKTNIIEIGYTNTDPVRARDVVNTLVRAYLEQAIGFKSEEASRTVGFVESQLKGPARGC